ncbi:MAG TPA: hypothetical protein DCQ64_26595 [Candidatus Rokubacteria bacterium]|nr:hypothetical protein [Candidatus Rokubacteria bacterium]
MPGQRRYRVPEATAIINAELGLALSVVTIRDYCKKRLIESTQPMGEGGWHYISEAALRKFIEARKESIDNVSTEE